jgi:DNA-binding transcriptional ArsR family regulator
MVAGVAPTVPGPPLDEDSIDRIFQALADATRRDIVMQAAVGELSVSALARRYPMSLAAVQKHVGVLERAHLVSKHRRGREQVVLGNADALRAACEVLDRLEVLWRGRVEAMSALLAEPQQQSSSHEQETQQ